MISAILKGGLGNQMFQIAAIQALAMENNDVCAFNFYNKVIHQGKGAYMYRDSIFKEFAILPRNWNWKYKYIEPRDRYNQIPYYKDMILDGYFASEKYFHKHKKFIVNLFKEKKIIDLIRDKYKSYLSNSVSLHVRRGDYIKLFSKIYYELTPEYYKNSLLFIESKTKIDHILVCSDDIEWCKRNLHDPRMLFMKGSPDIVDLYLMSLCNNHILANSSFSCWIDFLDENKKKIVCAPGKWTNPESKIDLSDIICDNWNII
jgi:hypothetical protein